MPTLAQMVPLTRSAGPAAGTSGGWLRRVVRARSADSPTKLQAATAATVLCALALSIGGWYAVDRRETAIDDAAGAAAQLIRVQDVRVLMVQADSIASNAYLRQGQELPEQRAEYDDRIATASSRMVEAASAAADVDIPSLQQASAQLARYVGLVEQARANNRQGFPVGAAYQRQARVVVEDLVVSLRDVEQSSRARVNDSMERAHRASWLLIFTSLLLLAVLVLGSLWLASRWRRLINVPIAVAGVIAVAVVTVGLGMNGSAASRATSVVRGPLTSADLLAQARAAGFDARSNEALTLIARGNGQAYEAQWQVAASIVDTALDESCGRFDAGCEAADRFVDYRGSHVEVRGLDDDGDWESAVALVTGEATSPTADPTGDFAAFAAAAEADLAADTAAATAGFANATEQLGTLQVLVVLAGLACAVLATVGYGQRLREYR